MAIQKITIEVKKLKSFVKSGLITDVQYQLIFENRFVKEIPATYKYFSDVVELYSNWYFIKTKGEYFVMDAVKGKKINDIIKGIDIRIKLKYKNQGNSNPNQDICDEEAKNWFSKILENNITSNDLIFIKQNKLDTYNDILDMWDIGNDFYKNQITLTQINNNLDIIISNIKNNNARKFNKNNSTIGGVDIDKAKRTVNSLPKNTDHIR